MKRSLILLILLVAIAGPLSAQQSPNFIKIDTATYRAYLNKDWNRVIEIGKEGLDNDIDYYYLRLRIGYAYFMKKQYRMAIPYYQAALRFSSKDATAMEYLYYSYLYGDRYNDALKLVNKFSPALKDYLHINSNNPITGISLFATFGNGATSTTKEAVNLSQTETVDGSQILLNSFSNYNLNLSHKLTPGVILHHSLNLLFKDEYSVSVVGGTSYLSESQIVRQISYRMAMDITPTPGLTITPAGTYVNYRIPIFNEYGAGMGKNRSVYTYNIHNEGGVSLKITKQNGFICFSIAGGYSYLNLSNQITGVGSITVYPLGNLNLYANASGYYHTQSQNGKKLDQIIQSYKLGFKIMNNLWVEGYSLLGDFSNLQDPISGITYNSLELYRAIYSANLYVPFSKNRFSVFAGYRNYNSISQFVPVDNVFDGTNNISFNYQTITGGIIWKL
jgi:tetratricopeptide (TPR) repeat protein